jgi:chemotaxis protein methyltransferase CheR
MVTITDREFGELADYIHANYGIRLGREKKALVVGRLGNFLLANNFASFTDYHNYLKADKTGAAHNALVNLITTNHTFFMRETKHFDYFRQRVLPELAAEVKDRDLRTWSAGCSSGEEPYTLAMIIDEFFGPDKKSWDTKILATDLSEKALGKARQGIYDPEDVNSLPPAWRMNYFRKTGANQNMVSEAIRQEVIFRRLNLMDDRFPFKRKFHVIFCRNVMIYFDAKTRRELVDKFYDATEAGGYLFIGHSESLDRQNTRYRYLQPAVYRKD